MRTLLIMLSVLFVPAVAVAQQDAGPTDIGIMGMDAGTMDAGTSTTGCGAITFEGECQGNVVVYCDEDNDEIIMVDCEVDYGPGVICEEINPTYGVWCKLPLGEPCIFEDAFSGDFFTEFCQGTNAGCVEGAQQSECTENVGPCTLAEVDTCGVDEHLVFDCLENQPWIIDCDGFAGTCETDPARGGGHCQVPGGVLCDPDGRLYCEPGASCGNLGICVDDNLTDAGTRDSGPAPRDAGMVGSEADGGCGCSGARPNGPTPGWALLVIAGAWCLRRTRERR